MSPSLKRLLPALAALHLALASVYAQTYTEARQQLMDGDYAAAAQTASALVERAPSTSAYRLLAVARSRRNQVGEAVWALRSASALGAATSRSAAAEETYATLPLDLRPLPRRGIDALAGTLSRSPVPQLPSALALGAALAACVFAVRWLLGGAHGRQGGATLGLTFSLLLALLCLGLAFRQNTLARPHEAVVLAKAPLRGAPADNAPEVRELPEGTVLETGEDLGGYVAVELPTGQEGWVAALALRRVAPLGAE